MALLRYPLEGMVTRLAVTRKEANMATAAMVAAFFGAAGTTHGATWSADVVATSTMSATLRLRPQLDGTVAAGVDTTARTRALATASWTCHVGFEGAPFLRIRCPWSGAVAAYSTTDAILRMPAAATLPVGLTAELPAHLRMRSEWLTDVVEQVSAQSVLRARGSLEGSVALEQDARAAGDTEHITLTASAYLVPRATMRWAGRTLPGAALHLTQTISPHAFAMADVSSRTSVGGASGPSAVPLVGVASSPAALAGAGPAPVELRGVGPGTEVLSG